MRVEYSKAFVKSVKKLSGKMLDSVRAANKKSLTRTKIHNIM